MKADIKIRSLIKLIPSFKATINRSGKYWVKFSLYFDWLIFNIDIDNY